MKVKRQALEILGLYLEDDPEKREVVHFRGLPLEAARQLLMKGLVDPRERQNESPDIEEFVELGNRYPDITFVGYAVLSPTLESDEGITFDGFHVPLSDLSKEAIVDLAGFGADEFMIVSGGKLRLWWD